MKAVLTGTGRYHAVMSENISIQKVRWQDEDRFMLVAMPDRKKPNDPFMRTSEAMTKDAITKLFRDEGMPEEEIQRLIATAESQSS
jgi:DNA-binding cell septation regulator SpoVG